MRIAPGNPTHNEPALSRLARGEEDFLLNAHEWQPDLIEAISDKDSVPMTPERCEYIEYLRIDSGKNPGFTAARVPLRHRRTLRGRNSATRRHRYQFLPRVYGQQACNIAGMRKPIPDA